MHRPRCRVDRLRNVGKYPFERNGGRSRQEFVRGLRHTTKSTDDVGGRVVHERRDRLDGDVDIEIAGRFEQRIVGGQRFIPQQRASRRAANGGVDVRQRPDLQVLPMPLFETDVHGPEHPSQHRMPRVGEHRADEIGEFTMGKDACRGKAQCGIGAAPPLANRQNRGTEHGSDHVQRTDAHDR